MTFVVSKEEAEFVDFALGLTGGMAIILDQTSLETRGTILKAEIMTVGY